MCLVVNNIRNRRKANGRAAGRPKLDSWLSTPKSVFWLDIRMTVTEYWVEGQVLPQAEI